MINRVLFALLLAVRSQSCTSRTKQKKKKKKYRTDRSQIVIYKRVRTLQPQICHFHAHDKVSGREKKIENVDPKSHLPIQCQRTANIEDIVLRRKPI